MAAKKNYVVVSNRSYGNNLKGTKIYFEGKQPKSLKKDGSISFQPAKVLILFRKPASTARESPPAIRRMFK